MKTAMFILAGLLTGQTLAALTIPNHILGRTWPGILALLVSVTCAFTKALRLQRRDRLAADKVIEDLRARIKWADDNLEAYCPHCLVTLYDSTIPMRRKSPETPASSEASRETVH